MQAKSKTEQCQRAFKYHSRARKRKRECYNYVCVQFSVGLCQWIHIFVRKYVLACVCVHQGCIFVSLSVCVHQGCIFVSLSVCVHQGCIFVSLSVCVHQGCIFVSLSVCVHQGCIFVSLSVCVHQGCIFVSLSVCVHQGCIFVSLSVCVHQGCIFVSLSVCAGKEWGSVVCLCVNQSISILCRFTSRWYQTKNTTKNNI